MPHGIQLRHVRPAITNTFDCNRTIRTIMLKAWLALELTRET